MEGELKKGGGEHWNRREGGKEGGGITPADTADDVVVATAVAINVDAVVVL